MKQAFNPDTRQILDSVYNGIVAIGRKGIITYFNLTAERIFNVSRKEALGRYILDVLPNTGKKLLECLESGRPLYGEKLEGERIILISNISPVLKGGQVRGVVSVFQEISEIEAISKELDLFKNLKNWLDTIIDSSYDGLWICDHQGKIIRLNKASERLNSIRAEDVIGRNVGELVAEGVFDKSVTLEVLKRKTSVTMIQQVKGNKKALVTGNPIVDENGEILFVVTNDRDITELDHLRSQLHETRALAEEYLSKISELEMKGVDLSAVVFRSAEMERILETSLRVAGVDSTVLLLGESGVGKGMIAKLIHKASKRANGPFMRVDCGGIPESLIESELFGYERGAFTGARADGKPGILELANHGTLFLDEVGEIPLNLQSKLLRFLEDHEVVRVGGAEAREINVRVLAATNRNLEEMVAARKFRKDLYYRLNVVPILIPSLRERREDIPPLIVHFQGVFNRAYQKGKTLSPEVVETLYRYDFPGNIRELANLMERLIVVAEKDRIELDDLPEPILGRPAKSAPYPPFPGDLPFRELMKKYEYMVLERAIKSHGSQRQAAKALKIDQGTISRKMKRRFFFQGS